MKSGRARLPILPPQLGNFQMQKIELAHSEQTASLSRSIKKRKMVEKEGPFAISNRGLGAPFHLVA